MALACAGCDTGPRDEQETRGPDLHVLGINVGASQTLPAGGAVHIAFDRYLRPATISRQSLGIVDASNKSLPPELAPLVTYDPVARTVTLAPPKEPWLVEGRLYKVVLGIPEGEADTGGLRAIDGATLAASSKRDFAFLVGPRPHAPHEAPRISFCGHVLPLFSAKCSASSCHGERDPAAGLALGSSAGVAAALHRVAHGASRGPSTQVVTPSDRRFGVDMPLIDPGNPGNSWLVYKLELAPPPEPANVPRYACDAAGDSTALPPFAPKVPNAQRYVSDHERAILSDFVLGTPMPFPTLGPPRYETTALTFDEREAVRQWIADLREGQGVPECGACTRSP